MIDVSDYSEEFRKLTSAGLDPGESPIGLYYLKTEFPKILSKSLPVASKTAKAFVLSSFDSVGKAKEGMLKECQSLEKDVSAFNYSSKEVQKLIDQGRQDVRAIPGFVRVNLNGMTFIEKETKRRDVASLIALANMNIGGKEVALVQGCAWFQVKAKILQITYTVPLTESKSIDTARIGLLDWAKAIQKAN